MYCYTLFNESGSIIWNSIADSDCSTQHFTEVFGVFLMFILMLFEVFMLGIELIGV